LILSSEESSCILECLNTDKDDSGRYSCQVFNEVGSDSCHAQLCIFASEPPYFIEKLEPMDVTTGDAVCLKCHIGGTHEIKVSWFKADGKLRSSAACKIEFTRGIASLKLSKAVQTDADEYTCKAENSIGSASSSCRLTVQGETSIINSSQTEGQPARFECRIAGSSPLEVSWLKDGEPLKENDEYSMYFDDNTAVLTISRGEIKHSGEYTCVATNSVGTASCRIFVQQEIIKFHPLKPLSVNEGEKLHLSCHVRGSLPMNIQWMKDRKEITSSAKTRITFVDGTATLEISSASKTDAGDYLCKATNDAGSEFCKARVATPFVELDISVKNGVTIRAGETLKLPAYVNGRPQPEVKWTKDESDPVKEHVMIETIGKNTHTTLSIPETDRKDSGLYTLTASNHLGSAYENIKVEIFDPVPGQCEKPTISSVTHNSMTVNWEEPEYDGGTPVIGYWLERKETTSKRWNRVTRDPIKVMPFGVSHNVSGLIEGSQYQFRVTAINAVGCGPPSLPSDPITATDPAGKWYMLFMVNNFSATNVMKFWHYE
uniref:Uncharacterized protein n=1 Tax=Paramormyrops kingsleyae TaxID=1676925 RepID=A0A3B3Q791_9TELE